MTCDGQTDLLGVQRVSWADPRPEADGTVDEASVVLGMARSAGQDEGLQAVIHSIPQELFFATAREARARSGRTAPPRRGGP